MATLRETDYIARLVAYLKRNLARGYSIDQLKLVLLKQGYSRSGVERAARIVQASLPKTPPAPPAPAPAVVTVPELKKEKNIFKRFFALFKKKKEKSQ